MAQESDIKTPGDILRLALEKETRARDAYRELATHCSVDFVRDLLLKLENEEYRHMRMIRDMLGKLESGKPLV